MPEQTFFQFIDDSIFIGRIGSSGVEVMGFKNYQTFERFGRGEELLTPSECYEFPPCPSFQDWVQFSESGLLWLILGSLGWDRK